jgi:hypothetical protein
LLIIKWRMRMMRMRSGVGDASSLHADQRPILTKG